MVKSLMALLYVLVLAPAAYAEVTFAVGSSLTFEYATDGRSIEARRPLDLRAGYRFETADLYLQYSTYRVAGGTNLVFVARDHEELLFWGRRVFVPEWKFSPYLALGIGAQADRVETALGAQYERKTGVPQGLVASALGARAILTKAIDLQLESRMAFSSGYAPNPMFTLSGLVGFYF